MQKKIFIVFILMLLCCGIAKQGMSMNQSGQRRVHIGFAAGFGLPKIPFSQFRTPISVLGGGSINFRLSDRIAMQLGGYGLHTFSLGKINTQQGELRFNLLWGSFDMMYRWRGSMSGETFVLVGVGGYKVSKQFGFDEYNLNTMGLTLGIAQWTHKRSWSSAIEFKWHLLFKPSDTQILTVTFVFML